MLEELCRGRIVEKVRYPVRHEGTLWLIDVYAGAAEGLVVAEVELGQEDQAFARPAWLGREISRDPRYRNSALARRRAGAAQAGWGAGKMGLVSARRRSSSVISTGMSPNSGVDR